MQFETKMTGIISVSALYPYSHRKFGTIVAPSVYAPIHQHFFNVRMEMMVDGEENCIEELNTRAYTGKDNMQKNAFFTKSTVFRTEKDAQRTVNFAQGRAWRIFNPKSLNWLGQPVAYTLVPGTGSAGQ